MKRSIPAAGALLVLLSSCSLISTDQPQALKLPELDDAGITTAVKGQLDAAEPRTLSNIDVETLYGTVYLTGTVADEHAERRAVKIARDVDGVDKVVNDLDTP